MENIEKKTAVIYARVSSAGAQESRQNTDRQVADLTKYAETAGYDVIETFEEHISGAKKNSERETLMQCLHYCIDNQVSCLLVSELSRLGRDAFGVLSAVQMLADSKVDLYCQKEQFHLLDESKKPSILAPIMISVLGTCAQMERENIKYRLDSGRAQYINKGGRLGRKVGYRKPKEKKEQEYSETIRLLRKGNYTISEVAKLSGTSISTVQRIKKEFIAG